MPENNALSTSYDPQSIEASLYTHWEKNGWFQPRGQGKPYCIMIPPPNVTGRLHMGHAFQDTLMDTLIRYHRMLGDNTLWQPGTDHAGIATQMLVERKLEAQGENRHDLGRERFIEKVWEWKAESGGAITSNYDEWVVPLTGSVNDLPWMTACPPPFRKFLSNSMNKA